jgi:hypothetical protein
MNKRIYRNLVINSTILFVIASTIEMTLHEFGHFVAGILVHTKDLVLFHNYVAENPDELSLLKVIIVKAAGPLVSLFIGILFQFICSTNSKRDLSFLLKLYMSVFGYIGFFGYLIIAPIFINGDTGYICHVLNFPIWLTILIAIIGVIILFLLMRSLVRYFVELGTIEIISTKESRTTFIKSLILLPLLIGILITTLLNLPIPTLLSLIAPICSPFTIMWTYGYALNKNYPITMMNKDLESLNSINLKWIVLLLFTIALNRLLVHGLTLT